MAELSWHPGHAGKGNVYPDGEISTWDLDGSTHHQNKAFEDGEDPPAFLFYITPEGGVYDGGIGFANTTGENDDDVIAQILQADPHLTDARNAGVDIPSIPPRVEDPGGYGHAWNFVSSEASPDELHVALEIPESVTKKILEWAKEVDWPEGTELEDSSEYHITMLYSPEGHEEHQEADWLRHTEGCDVEVVGVDEFGEGDEVATVLRVESPEIKEHADDLQDMAENRGLELSRFPGGYKPHITVAYGPGKPAYVHTPKLKFRSGPSSVSEPRVSSFEDDESSSAVQELRAWLDSFEAPSTQAPISLHHDTVQDLIPSNVPTAAEGSHVDPPDHPYEPYDWATAE